MDLFSLSFFKTFFKRQTETGRQKNSHPPAHTQMPSLGLDQGICVRQAPSHSLIARCLLASDTRARKRAAVLWDGMWSSQPQNQMWDLISHWQKFNLYILLYSKGRKTERPIFHLPVHTSNAHRCWAMPGGRNSIEGLLYSIVETLPHEPLYVNQQQTGWKAEMPALRPGTMIGTQASQAISYLLHQAPGGIFHLKVKTEINMHLYNRHIMFTVIQGFNLPLKYTYAFFIYQTQGSFKKGKKKCIWV